MVRLQGDVYEWQNEPFGKCECIVLRGNFSGRTMEQVEQTTNNQIPPGCVIEQFGKITFGKSNIKCSFKLNICILSEN